MPQRNINRGECEITQATDMAQMHMFDLAYRKHGFTRKIVHLETGLPLSTIKSYEEGTSMPIAAFNKIAGIKDFPNELLSLVLEPGGKTLCDAEADETDIDDLARAAVDILAKYVAARHPDSPGGIRIVHNEADDLRMAARGLNDRAEKVA